MKKYFSLGLYSVYIVLYLVMCAAFPAYPLHLYLRENNDGEIFGPAEWSILALSSVGAAALYGGLFFYMQWPAISTVFAFQALVALGTALMAVLVTATYVLVYLESIWLPWFSFRKISVAERFVDGNDEYILSRGLYWRRKPLGKYYVERQPWGGVPKGYRVRQATTPEGERIYAALISRL